MMEKKIEVAFGLEITLRAEEMQTHTPQVARQRSERERRSNSEGRKEPKPKRKKTKGAVRR